MTKRVRALALALALVPLLASCDQGPSLTPHLKFSFSGLASGTYDVTGIPRDGNERGVMAFVDSGIAILFGVNYDDTSPVGFVVLAFKSPAANELQFTEGCEAGSGCAGLGFDLTVTSSAAIVNCTMTSGTLTVSTSNNTQSSGTFSGTATCTDTDDETVVVGTLTIAGGSFAAKYGANPFAGQP